MAPPQVDVLIVCCGAPDTSMGHTHLDQLLHEPRLSARVSLWAVVEPFYLDPAHADLAHSSGFAAFADALGRERPSALLVRSLAELPARPGGRPCLAVLAPRTQDVPDLFGQLLACQPLLRLSYVLLEKPAAPHADGIAAIQAQAAAARVQVFVGYNKNVAQYTQQALGALAELQHGGLGAAVELHHDNDYAEAGLAECFGRCRAGMLRDMACHELAIAVCLFGLTAASLPAAHVRLDVARSRLETHGGVTDWRVLALSLALPQQADAAGPPPRAPTAAVRELVLVADRCGGETSRIVVRALGGGGEAGGAEAGPRLAFAMPPAEALGSIAARRAARPGLRSYLCAQWDDYIELKARILSHIELAAALPQPEPGTDSDGGPSDAPWPAGVASLQDAREVLLIAEALEATCRQQWEQAHAAAPGGRAE